MINNKKSLLSIAIVLLILFLNITAYANDLDLPRPTRYFYIYDEANIIDSDVENYIISINEDLFRQTGAQIVVATVNSLQGTTEQDFANRLFEKWAIGDSDKDNGVLMLVAPNEERLWIEIGYGLEGALPDGKVGEIRDTYIFPYFREGKYSEGVYNGFNALLQSVQNEYKIDIENSDTNYYTQDSYDEENTQGFFSSIRNILIVIGIIIFLIIDFTFFHGFLTMMILRSAMRGGFRGGGRGGGGNRGGGGSSGGGGAGGGW